MSSKENENGGSKLTVGILQARMSSSRLPGKVLKPILGQPMLQRQLERLQRAETLDKLIVATSDRADDQIIASLCGKLGIECYRGSMDDVLDRYYQVAKSGSADVVVRLTGDCPIIDHRVVDGIVTYYFEHDCDYVSTQLTPSWPNGQDAEVMSFVALEAAWKEANLKSQREHVTPFIWQNPERFKLANYGHSTDLSHMRWTVDEAEDFELVTAIYKALYPGDPDFDMGQILSFLAKNPQLAEINKGYQRNEGYAKSLAEDEVVA